MTDDTRSGDMQGQQSRRIPPLSVLQRIKLGCKMIFLLPRFLISVPLSIFSSRRSGSFKRELFYSITRLASAFTLAERRALQPASSSDAIRAFCEKSKLEILTVTLPTNEHCRLAGSLHSISASSSNTTNTNKVILYMPGGGYVMPAFPAGHIPFALKCAASANASLALLDYSVAPEQQYPGQLVQAVEALKLLLQDGKSAKDIIIVGDSAGGHLALSLLAHIKRPSPYAAPIDLGSTGSKIRAVVLVSPWIGLHYEAASYETNKKTDFLSKEALAEFEDLWAPKENEVWANPLGASPDEGFWRSVVGKEDGVVEKVLITAGTDEVLVDNIKAFSDLVMKGDNENVEYVECEGEIHAGAMTDCAAGLDGKMLRSVVNYLKAL